ncbi:MAG: alpha/beta hydrolase [Actinomycetota bacterium]|nr:alpha/beta hydrolase [Actinomycetota bacterium]
MTNLDGLRRHDVDAFGTRIHVAEIGEGPLVLFVHGFPESWYSWRNQLPIVAESGWRAAAIDVRGYGSSAVPDGIESYRLVHLAGDCVGVVEALGETSAVLVGHDWGSPIVSAAARLRPDVFSAVALLSVTYDPRNEHRPSEVFRAMGGAEEFYIEYFQEPGRAEAEIAKDPVNWLEGFYFSASGDSPPLADGDKPMGMVAPGGELRDRMRFPEKPLDWMSAEDLAFYVGEFARAGFTGGLNRYRCVDLDWMDLRAWHGVPLQQPSLFIGGEKDGPTLWGAGSIARYPQTLPNLHASVILPNVGHWMQQEDPDGVNSALLDFLASVR